VNYATAKEQRNIFIENTVRPYEYDIADLLSAISKNLGKKQIKVIDAHNTDIQVRAEIYQKMFDAGVLTMNEFKILYGLEPSKSAYANEHIIDKNKMLLSDIDISPVITIPSLP
jgi:predicted kinase